MKIEKKLKLNEIERTPNKRLPLQQRALDRVNSILTAAEDIIGEGLYDRLSIVDIAARAGITSTSIYHYFNSVEEIIAAIISRVMSDFQKDIDIRILQANTPEELIQVCIDGIHRGYKLYSSKHVTRGLWISARSLKTLRKMDDENNARTANLITQRFKQIIPGGNFEPIHTVMMLSVTLTMPVYELAMTQPKRAQRKMLEEFAEMVRLRLTTVVQRSVES